MNHQVTKAGEDDATLTKDYKGTMKLMWKNESQSIQKGLTMFGFPFDVMQYFIL